VRFLDYEIELGTALRAGAFTADAVALEARKAAEADDLPLSPPVRGHPSEQSRPLRAKVTFLSDWRMSRLPPDTRPLPSVAPYDQLSRHRRPDGDTASQGEAP
jgi:hypothetical protein